MQQLAVDNPRLPTINCCVTFIVESNFMHQTSGLLCREENQLHATEWFIALIICSTCFCHLYAHHQECETVLVLLPRMVCNALVAGGQVQGSRLCVRDEGSCSSSFRHPGRQHQLPRCYTPYAVITRVQFRALDDGHISAQNVSSRLQAQ